MKGLALAASLLLAAACGSTHGSEGVSTGSGAPITPVVSAARTPATASHARAECPAVKPAPTAPASAPSSRKLILVQLRGSQNFVVRDVTDIAHPVTVSAPDRLDGPQFVSATDLSSRSYFDENALVRMPLSGTPRIVVAQACRGMIAFAWNPSGTAAAYITDLSDGPGSQLHLIANGRNQVVAVMQSVPWGVDCAGNCADFADSRLLYSPNGSYVSLVQNWGGPILRVWTAEGKLLKSVDGVGIAGSKLPTMSVWSGNTLYYRDAKGVEAWTAGVEQTVLPGVSWIRPTASAAGGSIAYEVRDAAGTPNVFLLDTATGTARLLARSRSEPAFLTSRYIWWREERPCRASDSYPCGSVFTSVPTGKTFVYDLQDQTETESLIDAVFDVWPHPA
jgi:hypothetical protein